MHSIIGNIITSNMPTHVPRYRNHFILRYTTQTHQVEQFISLCLLTFTKLSTHFSASDISTPSDLSLPPIQNSLYLLLLAPKTCNHYLSISFLEYMLHQLLYPPTPPPVHSPFPSISQRSRYRIEIPSLSAAEILTSIKSPSQLNQLLVWCNLML